MRYHPFPGISPARPPLRPPAATILQPKCSVADVRSRYILSTVAPAGARHSGTRLRLPGDSGSGSCVTTLQDLSRGQPLFDSRPRRSSDRGRAAVVLIELGVVEQR